MAVTHVFDPCAHSIVPRALVDDFPVSRGSPHTVVVVGEVAFVLPHSVLQRQCPGCRLPRPAGPPLRLGGLACSTVELEPPHPYLFPDWVLAAFACRCTACDRAAPAVTSELRQIQLYMEGL